LKAGISRLNGALDLASLEDVMIAGARTLDMYVGQRHYILKQEVRELCRDQVYSGTSSLFQSSEVHKVNSNPLISYKDCFPQ
jgi:hypothetical protein